MIKYLSILLIPLYILSNTPTFSNSKANWDEINKAIDKKDFDTIQPILEELASVKNDSKAQYELASIYRSKKNFKRSLELLLKSAKQDFIESQYLLGLTYFNGSSGDLNIDLSIKWFKKAAIKGHRDSQWFLGYIYSEYKEKNSENARTGFEWYLKSAKQGSTEAQYNLGHAYFNGHGVKKDVEKSFEWFKKSADKGDSASELEIGLFYLNGTGSIDKNKSKATLWLKKAAAHGHAEANNYLSEILLADNKIDEAISVLKKVAQHGNLNANFNLGNIYLHKRYGIKNYKLARSHYELAAQKGHSDALNSLGYIYSNGLGVKRNFEKAFSYYKQAADKGDTNALTNIAMYYYTGKYVEKNKEKAFKYIKKAADKGDGDSAYFLALRKEQNRLVLLGPYTSVMHIEDKESLPNSNATKLLIQAAKNKNKNAIRSLAPFQRPLLFSE